MELKKILSEKVVSNETVQTANAIELHSFMGIRLKFSDWITRRIQKYGFIENQDYIKTTRKVGNATAFDYHITLDMAKELCMVENNEKGREARRYFIECEKQLKTIMPTLSKEQLDMLTPYAIKRDLSTARLRLTLAKKHNEKVIAEFTRLAKQRVEHFKEQEQLLKAQQDKMCVLQDKFYDTEDELYKVQYELENKTKELEQVQSELAMRTEETRQLNYRILDHEDTIEKMDKANPSYYRNIFNEDGEEPDKFYEPLLHNGFLDFMYKSSAIKDHIHRLMLTYPHIKEELEDKHNSLTIYLNSMRAFYSKLQGVNKITLEPFGQLEQI